MRSWKILCVLLLAALAGPSPWSAEKPEEEPKLLGPISPDQLGEEPYSEWFRKGYDEYDPNPEILAGLREIDPDGFGLTVFFGTWCPDSRRQVPRLLKLLDTLEFPEERLTLVAVDRGEEADKRSPGGEEKGVEVYRVPTMVVSRSGQEVARFVEHPVLSLERDLLSILSGEPYLPSYISYGTIRRWLDEGLLADENVSPRGLAAQVHNEVRSEWDLVAAGRVLLSRGDTVEAVKLFRVNTVLYPKSTQAFEHLAKGLRDLGELGEAREAAERALALNEEPWRVKELVELIDGTKQEAEADEQSAPK